MVKSEAEKSKILEALREITNIDEHLAIQLLENHNYDLETALNNYNAFVATVGTHRGADEITFFDKNPSDDEEIEYYAGGSTNSGLTILDPRERDESTIIKDATDMLDSVRNKALKEEELALKSDHVHDDTAAISGQKKYKKDSGKEKSIRMVAYSDGFSILNDQYFFPYSNPKTVTMLKTIKEGYMPMSIVKILGTSDRTFDLIEKRDQKYVKRFKAFSGEGQKLGNPAPEFVSNEDRTNNQGPVELSVDQSLPVEQVRIRLSTGKLVDISVNPTVHTVRQIYQVVASMTPEVNAFTINFTSPSQEINLDSEGDKTIQEANISKRSLIQIKK